MAAPESIRWTCSNSDSSDTSGDDCTRHVTQASVPYSSFLAQIHKKEDNDSNTTGSLLPRRLLRHQSTPLLGDDYTFGRGKNAAADSHDKGNDPVGTPLFRITNVWSPQSSLAVSPCHPSRNSHTAKDNGDEEERIVFDSDCDEEECIVFDADRDEEECIDWESPPSLSSSDTGDTTHSTSWDVDLEQQDVSKVVVEDQSAASLANGTSSWKVTPVSDAPTMKSGTGSTVSRIQANEYLQNDVSEPQYLESWFHQEILQQARRVDQLCKNTNDMQCLLHHCLSQNCIRNEDEEKVKCHIPEAPIGMKEWAWYDYCHVTIRLWIKHELRHGFYVTICQCLSYEVWTMWRILYQRTGLAWLDSCRRHHRDAVCRSILNDDASLERNSQWKSAVLVMLLCLVVVGTVSGTSVWSWRNCRRRNRLRMVVLVPMHSSIPVLWSNNKAHHQDHLQQHLLQVESQGVWEYQGSEPSLLH